MFDFMPKTGKRSYAVHLSPDQISMVLESLPVSDDPMIKNLRQKLVNIKMAAKRDSQRDAALSSGDVNFNKTKGV